METPQASTPSQRRRKRLGQQHMADLRENMARLDEAHAATARATTELRDDIRAVLQQMKEISQKMATAAQVEQLDQRMRSVEKSAAALEPDISNLGEQVSLLRQKIETLEEEIETKADQTALVEVDGRVKPLEHAHTRALTIIWIVQFLGFGGIAALVYFLSTRGHP